MIDQTTKLELAKYYHAALFIPSITIRIKTIKQGFLKTWSVLTEQLIKKHLYKSMNTSMGHLHMNRQGVKSARKK